MGGDRASIIGCLQLEARFLQQRRGPAACENGEHLLYETRSSLSQKNPAGSRSWRIKRSVRGDTAL